MDDEDDDDKPRGFGDLIAEVGNGELHRRISKDLHKLIAECRDYSDLTAGTGKGELAIKLVFRVEPDGAVRITGDVKTKAPRVAAPGGSMWLSRGGNLVASNTRQRNLPGIEDRPTRDRAAREARDVGRKAGE